MKRELKSDESQIMRIMAQRASYRLVLITIEKHSNRSNRSQRICGFRSLTGLTYTAKGYQTDSERRNRNKLLLIILVSNKAQ